jgi:hypothetical protein
MAFSPIVRGPQSAYMSRCQQVVPEGKDDKPQRPGELVPLHNVVALLVVLPPPPSRLSATRRGWPWRKYPTAGTPIGVLQLHGDVSRILRRQ